MTITPSKLRENIYKILDEIIATGAPIAVKRHGVLITLNPEKKKSRLDRMIKRPLIINGDPEDFVHIDWSYLWKPKFI